MQLVGARGQQNRDFTYDASGTIAVGGTPQLIVPERTQNTSWYVQNISSGNLFIEIGPARASATITNGAVTAIIVTNGGFGYTVPPHVRILGGGDSTKNPNYLCPGLPGNICPSKLASAHAVLTAGVVTSIVIDNPGANYVEAPYIHLQNSEQDPYGCATPSATNGILLTPSGGSIFFNGTVTTTDGVSIYGATTGQAYTFKFTK